MHKPTTSHWSAVKRVLPHLKGTITYGIFFFWNKTHLSVHAICDADWAGNKDNCTSTGAYNLFLGHNHILRSFKRQCMLLDPLLKLNINMLPPLLLNHIG